MNATETKEKQIKMAQRLIKLIKLNAPARVVGQEITMLNALNEELEQQETSTRYNPALMGASILFEHESRKYIAHVTHNNRPSVVGARALFRRMAGTYGPA